MKLSSLATLLLAFAVSAPALAVEQLGYRVLDKKPLPPELWTQGLEIVAGKLYLSTGKYGRSALLMFDFESGELEKGTRAHPRMFAEGLTVLGTRVYQLTWKERAGLVYDQASLEAIDWFRLRGEGWGLTNDGQHLIYSDGSHQLHYLSPTSYEIMKSIDVLENGKPVSRLNELEWIDGKIWANVWQTDRIVIIDPDSGAVTATVDLSGLLPPADRRPGTNVLNGIARDPGTGAIWVTGKRWPWLFHIETVPAAKSPKTIETR
jgi:glutamine cyclotransferase